MNAVIVSMIALKLNDLESDCPARGAVPPSVRPGVEYDGAGAPASLTAFSIAVVRPRTSAPRIVLITEPDLNIIKVGILEALLVSQCSGYGSGTYAVTPYFCEISCWLSTLILVKVTRFGFVCLTASDSYVGAIALHGPHQSA